MSKERNDLREAHRELCSLSIAIRGPGGPTMREVERRISNLAAYLHNRHDLGPPGSNEPPRPPGRKRA